MQQSAAMANDHCLKYAVSCSANLQPKAATGKPDELLHEAANQRKPGLRFGQRNNNPAVPRTVPSQRNWRNQC
jgi:hypothetical protein